MIYLKIYCLCIITFITHISIAQPQEKSETPIYYIEQFFTGFYGKGMLKTEVNDKVTEHSITSFSSAGSKIIKVADNSEFEIGSTVSIKHFNGLYWTYRVKSKSTTGTIEILPALKFDVDDNSRLEKTWYNAAHPGKFYIRQLAQRIALTPEFLLGTAQERILFYQYGTIQNDHKDTISAIGEASIKYVDQLKSNQGAHINISVVGDGGKTSDVPVKDGISATLRFIAKCQNPSLQIRIKVVDDQGRVNGEFKMPTDGSSEVSQVYTVPINILKDAKTLRVEFIADVVPVASSIIVEQVEVFESKNSNSPIIQPNEDVPIIIVLGDSWVAGYLTASAEREPITYELAKQLPFAKIINKGVGGERVQELINRFDTDVRAYNPDYVIINTGTNDAYRPASKIFFPNSVDFYVNHLNELISLVKNIGAKPIIIGVPALRESELNNRARAYNRNFYKSLIKTTY